MTEQEQMDTTFADGNETAENTEVNLSEQLAAAQEEAARNLEGWQRAQAEFANARKRMEKQRADAYIDANIELARKLLPVVDDMDRALNLPRSRYRMTAGFPVWQW
ncbi:MAG: nucleotide exchange factor GrpE [Chloroflexota bacterium]